MKNKKEKACIVCKATSNEMPLISFKFKGKKHHICSQHIPILIHKAGQLQDLLPGIKDSEE